MDIDISILYKAWSFVKTLFWRNNKIIYINSNKKIQSFGSIDSLTKTKGYHRINCQSRFKSNFKLRNYKLHLFRMKRHLYDISRNSDEADCITYSGFVSTMFAAFDGYCLGDNKNYCFIDCNSGNSVSYKINYSKKLTETPVLDKPTTKSVNVLFCCGHTINNVNLNGTTYHFIRPQINKITQSYLRDVFTFSKNRFRFVQGFWRRANKSIYCSQAAY